MKNKKWFLSQIIQLVIFVIIGIFIFTRNIDGHGSIQTMDAKIISFGVWLGFYIFMLAIEWIIYFIVDKSRN